MATSQKDLEGWQVVTIDENGKIIQDSGRRSRKKIPVENVYIQRTSDGLSFGRGDIVVPCNNSFKPLNISVCIISVCMNHVMFFWSAPFIISNKNIW